MTATVYAFPTGREMEPAEVLELEQRGAQGPEAGALSNALLYLTMLQTEAGENAGDTFELPSFPLAAYKLGLGHAENAIKHAMGAWNLTVPA
jgi:hypothetical protein